MKFQSVNKAEDIFIHDVNIEFDSTNSVINCVTVRDAYGNLFRCRANYGMSVEVPAPPEMKKVWRFVATKLGARAEGEFDHEWECRDAAQPYINEGFEVVQFEAEVVVE